MREMKVISTVGARPQFVKMAMISRELVDQKRVRHIVIHTGQHFDWNMSDLFLEELGIPMPDYNLRINSLPHGAMTGRMLEAVEGVLLRETPDLVLVYGDTNSTLAGALAAKKLKLKVGHIEAGLRSHNLDMPEELNRVLTDRISDVLFCPTETAVGNLKDEGFGNMPCTIVMCGDVMYDASLYYRSVAGRNSDVVRRLGVQDFVLSTIHRAENTDDSTKLGAIVRGLNRIAEETTLVVPLHPRTRRALTEHGIKAEFTSIDPVGYLDMIELLKHCRLVITDSGGLQKEAYFFGKACLTLRNETEWSELVDLGYNRLTGADADKIYDSYRRMSGSSLRFEDGIYGDGCATRRIVDQVLNMAAGQ